MLCELCGSEDVHNFHHFIPRTLHSNKWFKKRYTPAALPAGGLFYSSRRRYSEPAVDEEHHRTAQILNS